MPEDPAASFAHARAAAGVLFFDDQDRIMLVEPTYKNYLDAPGGYVERGETPHQAATREVAEELGIRPKIGRLLVTDWAPTETEGDKILFLFDGGTLTPDQLDAIRLDPTELRGYDFHDVTRIYDHTIPRLARRRHPSPHRPPQRQPPLPRTRLPGQIITGARAFRLCARSGCPNAP